MTGFFIPHLRDNPAAAEAEWQRYVAATRAPLESRRVYRLVYEHDDGARYEVTVGEERKQFRRKTGPRGGRIPNADHERCGRRMGAVVLFLVFGLAFLHLKLCLLKGRGRHSRH